jgi:ABC-type branched-subunit amino acid transport system ATPase component
MTTSRRARAGLAYVPQTREIFASLSVEENLALGLRGRPVAALEEAFALFQGFAIAGTTPDRNYPAASSKCSPSPEPC